MGREIRRVPLNWEHPKNERGHFQPMYDQGHKAAVAEWLDRLKSFLEENPTGFNEHGATFWDWEGNPPDEEHYRPDWPDGEATAYQVYENVSEGTPCSPVFATADDLRQWLINGKWELSEKAADYFIETGYSFSMIMVDGYITRPGAETIEKMADLDS